MKPAEPSRKGIFLGMAAVDFIYEVGSFPEEDSKIMAQRRVVCAGGPAANAAATFGFLGGEAVLAGAIGAHPVASIIREDLGGLGVRIADLTPHSTAVPIVASILVSAGTGRRTVISTPGASASIDASCLNELRVEEAGVVLVDGHYMEAAIGLAQRARAAGVPVVADGGSWKPRFDELLRCVDVAICSAAFRPPGISGDADTLQFLLAAGPRCAAITHGGEPIRWAASAGESGQTAVPKVEVVDTLAAGDVFHGAFCWHWVRGSGLAECLASAAAVAAASCRRLGPRAWMRESAADFSPSTGPARTPSQS